MDEKAKSKLDKQAASIGVMVQDYDKFKKNMRLYSKVMFAYAVVIIVLAAYVILR